MMHRRAAIALGCLLALGAVPAAAGAADTGPALDVPQAQLDASLQCAGALDGSGRTPVLMVPGTTLNPEDEWSFSYFKAFKATNRPYCAVTIPERGMGDIQVAAEYVVNGIRTMHARAGRKISVLGHSQGGMSPRWALKYWPDTRGMVDDLVGIAPSNHGTLTALAICPLAAGVPCQPSIFQQRAGSAFMTALNRGPETYAGISYTVAYTRSDEVVTPNLDATTGSSALRTGAGLRSNIALQAICGLNYLSEHLVAGSYDGAAYALAVDALDHAGPASEARVRTQAATICKAPPLANLNPALPGVDTATLPVDFAGVGVAAALALTTSPRVPAEPALKPYVTAAADGGATTTTGIATPPASAAGVPAVPSAAPAAPATPVPVATAPPAAAVPTGAGPTIQMLTAPRTGARRGAVKVRIRCATACAGTARLRIGGRTYASRGYALTRPGSRTLTLRLGPEGRRALGAKDAASRLQLRS